MADPSITRRLEFPPAIVWDALVDPVLVEGWLHPELRLVESAPGSDVEVRELDEPVVLSVVSERLGALRFALTELPGGPRDTSTELTVSLAPDAEPGSALERIAGWRTRLDQLADLLHGHPVDWDHWDRDRRADFEAHLADARAGRIRSS